MKALQWIKRKIRSVKNIFVDQEHHFYWVVRRKEAKYFIVREAEWPVRDHGDLKTTEERGVAEYNPLPIHTTDWHVYVDRIQPPAYYEIAGMFEDSDSSKAFDLAKSLNQKEKVDVQN